MHTSIAKILCRLGIVLALVASVRIAAFADVAATGSIQGRVFNPSSGLFVENVRITALGTSAESLTNSSGEYHLANVPVGTVEVTAAYAGSADLHASVNVSANATATLNFTLQSTQVDKAVKLGEFVVEEKRVADSSEIAINQKRAAPNIESVASADEFGDIEGGNVGEFLKYLPGVAVNYSSWDASSVSIRGFPANRTSVTVDGERATSAISADRAFNLGGLALANISTIAVTKSPTPDISADALGGAVNIVSKGSFQLATPDFSYKMYAVTNPALMTFSRIPGASDHTSVSRIQPGIEAAYIAPVSKTFGFTVSGVYVRRYDSNDQSVNYWAPLGIAGPPGTASNPALTQFELTLNPQYLIRIAPAVSLDWKPRPDDMITLGLQYSTSDSAQDIPDLSFATSSANSYGPTFTNGGAKGGSATETMRFRDGVHTTTLARLSYRHDGSVWALDGGGALSHGKFTYRAGDDMWGRVSLKVKNLALNFVDIDRNGPGQITATDTAGNAVDLFNTNSYQLSSTQDNPITNSQNRWGAHLNAARGFDWKMPIKIKVGLDTHFEQRDSRAPTRIWTFVGPDGVAATADDTASNYNVLDDNGYNSRHIPFRLPHVEWVNNAKVWQLYRAHPEYFQLDQAGAISNSVAASTYMTEDISAAYVRADLRVFDRLLLIGGVRNELTVDDGYGPLTDIKATYQQDAQGNLILGSNGKPIAITTDPVAKALLEYKDRGDQVRHNYDGFFPSLNAIYTINDSLIARAAYSRTIGRPDYAVIIPGVSISDPASTAAATITVHNTALKPWMSNSYDLALEYYSKTESQLSVGVFQKDISNFFGTTQTPATADNLSQYGLTPDYAGYTIITQTNVGDAQVSGIELDCRQSFGFAGPWLKGLSVFANATVEHLQGSTVADFNDFKSKLANFGFSYARPRFAVTLNWNYRGRQRMTPITVAGAEPGAYYYLAALNSVSFEAQYRISRRISLFGRVDNLSNDATHALKYGPATPYYASQFSYLGTGRLLTFGIKGDL